ncbi:hypothetical protein OG723_44420 (plasmid) [Streptomyces sp. NBC_01278]|uniref:hypothetical protein n=1 Tax=Streptomyces sp. NBC_01278 TaxID=2903809 RepID=UPI002E37C49C|nr:hypothetical protein [Streptomyces sp. NBC_01278]
MAFMDKPSVRSFHAVVTPGATSTVHRVTVLSDHGGRDREETELRTLALARNGFVTSVYAAHKDAAAAAIAEHATAAWNALNRPTARAHTPARLAVVFNAGKSWSSAELDVHKVIPAPACMYGERAFIDYLTSLGLDRYEVTAPDDATATELAWDLFLDDVYATFLVAE